MSPPPILTPASSVGSPPPPLPPQPNSAIPPVSCTAGAAGSSVTPGAAATAARKRQHPDNEAPARDTKSAAGGVNIVREIAGRRWRGWLVPGIVLSRRLASLVDSVLLR